MANFPQINMLSLADLYFTDGKGNYRFQWSTSALVEKNIKPQEDDFKDGDKLDNDYYLLLSKYNTISAHENDGSDKAVNFVCRVYDKNSGDLVKEIKTSGLSAEIALDKGEYLWEVAALDAKDNVITRSDRYYICTMFDNWDDAESDISWQDSSSGHIISKIDDVRGKVPLEDHITYGRLAVCGKITNEENDTFSGFLVCGPQHIGNQETWDAAVYGGYAYSPSNSFGNSGDFNISGDVFITDGGIYVYENGQWNYKFFVQPWLWGTESFDNGGNLIFCDSDESQLNKTIYRWNASTGAFQEYRTAKSQIYRICEKYYMTKDGIFSNETGKQILKYNVVYGEHWIYNDFFFNIYIKDKSGRICDSIEEGEEGSVMFKYAFINQNGTVGKQGEIEIFQGTAHQEDWDSEEMFYDRIGNCICLSLLEHPDQEARTEKFVLVLQNDGTVDVEMQKAYGKASFSLDRETGNLICSYYDPFKDMDVDTVMHEKVDFTPVFTNTFGQVQHPENVSADLKNNDVTVTWDKVTAPQGVKVSYEMRVDGEKIYTTTANKYILKKANAGKHSFEVRAIFSDKTDSAISDWSGTVAAEIKDITPPKTGTLKVSQKPGEDTVLVEWTEATDNVGIDRYVVTCGNKDIEEIEVYPDEDLSYEFSGVSGKVTVTLTPYDEAGNAGKTVKKTITMKDVTPPDQVTGLYAENVDNKSGGILTWTVPFDNVGVTQYLVSVEDENGKKTSYTSKTNSLKLKKLNAGNYKFTVIAVDKAKNQSIVSEECPFEVHDVIDPKVSKLSSKVTNNSALVTWKATDETGIARLELSLDGGDAEDVTELGSYTFSGLSEGDHQLCLIAYDEAGRKAVKEVSFKVKEQKTKLPAGAVALDTANAVSPESDYEGEYYGEISAGETRLFRFSTEIPSMLKLYSTIGCGNGTVTIYRETGTGLGVKIGSAQFSNTEKDSLKLPLDQPGTYYISATASRGEDLYLDWLFASADFGNNSLESATDIYISLKLNYLCAADPVDWFKFTVDEPGTYEYGACYVRYGKVSQTLYDANGSKIVSKNITHDSDSRYFAAGDYYLKCEYTGKSTDYTVCKAMNW